METFKDYLVRQNLSKNTIAAYLTAVSGYKKFSEEITKKNLLLYKTYLIENFKAKSVNLKIQSINRYFDYIG